MKIVTVKRVNSFIHSFITFPFPTASFLELVGVSKISSLRSILIRLPCRAQLQIWFSVSSEFEIMNDDDIVPFILAERNEYEYICEDMADSYTITLLRKGANALDISRRDERG